MNKKFWDTLQTQYPAMTNKFYEWHSNTDLGLMSDFKIWELPTAFQYGLFLQFVAEVPNKYGIAIGTIHDEFDYEKIPDRIKLFFATEKFITKI